MRRLSGGVAQSKFVVGPPSLVTMNRTVSLAFTFTLGTSKLTSRALMRMVRSTAAALPGALKANAVAWRADVMEWPSVGPAKPTVAVRAAAANAPTPSGRIFRRAGT
jgi:hypothetical protein